MSPVLSSPEMRKQVSSPRSARPYQRRGSACARARHLATRLGVTACDRPILPLYLRDPTMHEEACCACGESLVDLVPGIDVT